MGERKLVRGERRSFQAGEQNVQRHRDKKELSFFFLCFGCTGSQLQHMESLVFFLSCELLAVACGI